eukprot:m.193237 g.193237  ORF g.193237 m.193237 type:complete len:584 (-) comp18878_c0_seq1:120-1871(-)
MAMVTAAMLAMMDTVYSAGASTRTDRPNFLFVLADDTGWGDVGFNNKTFDPPAGGGTFTYNPPRTPNLDAWATGPGSVIFDHFYSGNPVCSPTRSALLSGRTPFRDCIYGANEQQPFPAVTPTVAQQVKSIGYRTLFIGKWHLGCLYGECLDWQMGPHNTTAVRKWKSANPGNLGFTEHHATIAVTPTSTTNCGCSTEWALEGCIAGGGSYVPHFIHNTSGPFFDKGMSVGQGYFRDAVDCQTFWTWSNTSGAYCSDPTKVDRDCVTNYSKKIPGDLTLFDVGLFEDFLEENVSAPFLAYIALSTNHVPHYALPEWYHAYTDNLGNPAGDYLGSLSQMDDSLGKLHEVLIKHGVNDNTMVWFSTDNGPHTLPDSYSLNPQASARSGGQLAATNGLRQCKASVFEGGIRVPGFIVWPARLGTTHRRSTHLTSSLDFMATVNDIVGLPYPRPTWTVDSKSVLPILDGTEPLDSPRNKVLGWQYGEQQAVTNQTSTGFWKIVQRPALGQCQVMLPPYTQHAQGPFLFDLNTDPTESHDLCPSNPQQCEAMTQLMTSYLTGVANSQVDESGCEATPQLYDPHLHVPH